MANLWRSFREWSGSFRGISHSPPELTRSQYSVVSSELTPGALKLWVGLPEEVKYDPALACFREHYEKEYDHRETALLTPKSSGARNKRLPQVNSAPLLNESLESDVANEGTNIQEKDNGLNGSGLFHKKSKIENARQYTKMTLLIGCWIFFTVVFVLYNEKEEIVMNSFISPEETKEYIFDVPENELTLLVKLRGPFMTEPAEKKLNFGQLMELENLQVWLERRSFGVQSLGNLSADGMFDIEKSKPWEIVLQNDKLDFTQGEPRSSTLGFDSSKLNNLSNLTMVYAIRMRSSSAQTLPFTMTYVKNPLGFRTGIIYAFVLLCGLYGLIIFEVINRTLAAMLMSTVSIAVLTLVGERPSIPELISWMNMETLLLLFSMMLLVAILAETGMFDSLAVYAFQITKGKIWPLIAFLCATTALVSTFLDNVTTVLLMAPVTIRLCEVTGLDPVPILMSMVLYSNIGGTATPVGDPPNVIISSHKAVIQAGIHFTNFTIHMSVGILLVCVQTFLQLKYWHIDTKKLRPTTPREIQDLKHQISIWKRTSASLPHLSADEQVVKERLERKILKMNAQLKSNVRESTRRACPKATFDATLADLKDKYKIRDRPLLIKASVATVFVIAFFFMHSIPELNRVSLGWTALLGAILLLILVDREDLEPVLRKVEWSTLLFFAALFVLMEALSKLGLIEFIGGLTESLILAVDEKARLAVAIMLILWVSGLTLAFLDNIPLTTMMVRVVTSLGTNPTLNLPLPPLIWALSFGACLGGNGTLIGASANVVCAGVAEQHGYKFTFMQFFKIGFPVMIGHLVVTSAYLLLCHCVFSWHL